jgi:hypothetical protein
MGLGVRVWFGVIDAWRKGIITAEPSLSIVLKLEVNTCIALQVSRRACRVSRGACKCRVARVGCRVPGFRLEVSGTAGGER